MAPLPDDKQLRFVKQEDRSPMSPQLVRRVAMVGMFALALFAILYFRLWFLQVLSSNQYAKAASVNFIRDVDVAAPRGEILASDGQILASSQRAYAVEISPPSLPVPITDENLAHPPQRDAALYDRLAGVLGLPTKRQQCPVDGHGLLHMSQIACEVVQEYVQLPYATATVGTDISSQQLWYISERQSQLPGVSVQQTYQRTYPFDDLAAQVIGSVGRINGQEVKESEYSGVNQNDIVGQSGLEASYNRYLQGVDGANRVQVNALGDFEGYLSQKLPVPGSNLKTSLNVGLQQVGQQALQESVEANGGAGGAFVAMNPQNGQVYAMGSSPTYNANVFNGSPIPQSVYDQLNNASSNYPLIDRADQSVGPTGSTFKPITATAALESGVWGVDDTYDDTGQFCIDGECRRNSGGAANGVVDLVNAIRVSDDVFFYNLGALTNSPASQGGALQHWASLYGIGRNTGIDLPDSADGTLPTPAWRANRNELETECEDATGPFKGHPKHPASQGGCGIAIVPEESWTVGDNINLAVGQGDVQVSPLQLAVAYSAIANGGTIVTPHIGEDIQSSDGMIQQTINPGPKRHLNVDPLYLDTIREGLRAAASQPGGTSDDVMGNFPEQVYGKTGTAQYISSDGAEQDYAWYACFVPATATSKPIVTIVWVEQGGFGDVGAAPVARQILSQWFFGSKGAYITGSSRTL
jgi:penicillin-binding protein 2